MIYTWKPARGGISEPKRALLEKLHIEVPGPFTTARAAEVLGMPPEPTRALLGYLTSRGWLSRIRRGLYTTVPLGAASPSEWREDPWLVAASTFSPCYMGGWSACEHWDLTEQLFREVVVITGTPLRTTHRTVQGTPFRLKFVDKAKHFGTRPVWRGQTKVQVSDPSRTVVDILDDPRLGGGIRQVAEVVEAYFGGDLRNDEQLIDYARRLGNRTVFKRLGYLVETLCISAPNLIARCRAMQSSGLTLLDPAVRQTGRIVKRWNLRVNVAIQRAEGVH